ncbi:hypothetical protein Tco_0301090 [Tanacetum coccineum]
MPYGFFPAIRKVRWDISVSISSVPSASSLTADFSGLTLTLTFLDFEFDFDFVSFTLFHSVLAHTNDEANVAFIEEWDDIQAKIEADHELAQRLQAEEQEELYVEEKAKLFQQLLEQRRKYFAAKSAEEKRNKPTNTKLNKRKIKMFDIFYKRENTFVDFRTDLVEGSSKRAGEELEQESTKKQKVDEDKDTTELQSLMEVILDEEEVAIDVVPLSTKPPTILVKAKYKSTRPVEDLDLVLWSDLKTMFEPHVEDEIWKLQQRYQVLSWTLLDYVECIVP